MALGQVELAARVAAGLFVVVAPTLLFLALWRGLQSMQDDALVERVRQRAERSDESGLALVPTPSAESPTVSCPNCGAGNRDGVAYCRQCLAPL
ncbi:zinc ribbon domain-containing protein [Haloarcula sp. S1CR25-12]|uniref:Zinc ribbon domain-containing protein n=1 Tax=Haloarcula saliterrae TaxID=2950534 RepID=A0ABU2FEU4_9EURY|nr:zinc ribbon domain-containing protein [Haloarcula sp. S1CR25-12]MDS0260240.1 zinc ribbon domain-containing protein [Haloarcula sp. S1CR25-12]